MELQKKIELRQKRIWRARRKISGTADRPRLAICFTNKHIYAQAINDETGSTLVYVSTLSKEKREEKLKSNLAGAKLLGTTFGEKAKAAGITKVVFDRHGKRYHGCVKEFAEAARAAGLVF